MRPSGARADGFTVLEVIVALAIMVTISAVVAPNLLAYLDRVRVDRAVESLESVSTALGEFHDDVGEWPLELTQLVSPITTSDRNSCASTYSGAEVNRWGGPYVNRFLDAGVPLGIGTAANVVFRVPPVTGFTTLHVVVPDVSEEDAVALDRRMDGDGDLATGSVRRLLPADGSGRIVLLYMIPVSGC